MLVSELSREAEMALTLKWQAVVGDEYDIVVRMFMLFIFRPISCCCCLFQLC